MSQVGTFLPLLLLLILTDLYWFTQVFDLFIFSRIFQDYSHSQCVSVLHILYTAIHIFCLISIQCTISMCILTCTCTHTYPYYTCIHIQVGWLHFFTQHLLRGLRSKKSTVKSETCVMRRISVFQSTAGTAMLALNPCQYKGKNLYIPRFLPLLANQKGTDCVEKHKQLCKFLREYSSGRCKK